MPNVAKRPDGRWRARYRDAAGKEHSRHFPRKLDAQRWLDEVTTSVVTGQYVDPKAGRVTFATFYAEWAARQVWEATTVLAMDLAASSVPFAQLPLADLRRSHVELWVKQMTTRGLAPGTVRTRVNNVRAVLRAAVRDRVIASDPSDAVTLPRLRRAEAAMTLPTNDQVGAVLAAADERFRALVALAAFAGLRWGEAAGLQVGDVDYLRRLLVVRRQVQRARGRCRGGATSEVRQRALGVLARRAARAAEPARLTAPTGQRPVAVDVRGDARAAAAPEHRRASVAASLPAGRRHRGDAARPPALLRQWTDRRGL